MLLHDRKDYTEALNPVQFYKSLSLQMVQSTVHGLQKMFDKRVIVFDVKLE